MAAEPSSAVAFVAIVPKMFFFMNAISLESYFSIVF